MLLVVCVCVHRDAPAVPCGSNAVVPAVRRTSGLSPHRSNITLFGVTFYPERNAYMLRTCLYKVRVILGAACHDRLHVT
jgi:hypothetical protein